VGRARGVLLAFALLAVAAVTLRPARGDLTYAYLACVFCGQRAASDALLNLILFAPLGFALGLFPGPALRRLMPAVALTLLVEFAQLYLPGRDPSLGDLLFNSLGAGLGMLAARTRRRWAGAEPARRRLLLAVATLLAVGALGATGVLLQPAYPDSTYFGQWAPNLAHLEWYRARVRRVSLGGLPLPSQELKDRDSVRAKLARGDTLTVEARAGAPVPGVGSLFSIADDWLREIVLLGPDRDDLVWRYRTRAAALRLDQPDVRALGLARRLVRGQRVLVSAWRSGNGWCLAVNGESACGLGFRLREGWALLMYPESFPYWLRRMLGAGWLLGLLLPIGFYSRRDALSAAAAALALGAIAVVPQLTALAPSSPLDLGAGAAGLLCGAAWRAALPRGARHV
jgi:hypothetical protein